MSREEKEGKSPAEDEVWSPGAMWDGSGAATWSIWHQQTSQLQFLGGGWGCDPQPSGCDIDCIFQFAPEKELQKTKLCCTHTAFLSWQGAFRFTNLQPATRVWLWVSKHFQYSEVRVLVRIFESIKEVQCGQWAVSRGTATEAQWGKGSFSGQLEETCSDRRACRDHPEVLKQQEGSLSESSGTL